MNNIKNWKVQALKPTFPVTLNVQCFNKEATEINELLETEAHNISSDKPYIIDNRKKKIILLENFTRRQHMNSQLVTLIIPHDPIYISKISLQGQILKDMN